jgi:hypothetical protein
MESRIGAGEMTDAKRIKELLRERVADLAQYLFPNGYREGNRWRVGSIDGEAGNSFDICIEGTNAGYWGDWAGSQKNSRNLIDLWMAARHVDFKTALEEARQWLGLAAQRKSRAAREAPKQVPRPFNWQACVDNFAGLNVSVVAKRRGFAKSFVSELHQAGKIGMYISRGERRVAFPVYKGEAIVGLQYRVPPKEEGGKAKWFYEPKGTEATPLVFGTLTPGQRVIVSESIFDGLAWMERTGERDGIIIARGAKNGARAAALIPKGSTAYVLTQNDEPGAIFEKEVAFNTQEIVRGVGTPERYKDINAWTFSGATASELLAALKAAEIVPSDRKRDTKDPFGEPPPRNPFGDIIEEEQRQKGSDAEAIRRLAAMPWLEYERIRKAEAKKLSYRVSVLDRLVEARKSEKPRNTEAPVEAIPLRIAKLKEPGQPVSFERWRGVIRENFPILLRPAEVCLSVVAQLLLNDVSNPFAIALVDVPSSSKTITLNFFDGPTELTYTTDNFTPASFVSHASNVKREDLGNVDLLPRIRYHTLIVRDLGSIFGANDDDLIKSLGILTRVLDGEGLETDSGVHGRRGYKGDYLFMLLAGTPPIQPRVFKIMGNFGSRLFFLRLHTPDDDDDELIAQNKGTAWKLKESACRRATENFLRTLWAANQEGVTWNKAEDPDDCLRVIARCARLLARLRGAINVWSADEAGEKLLHTVPVIEKPRRINCLLYNLARAHALICGRRQLTVEDLWPVLDVTFDTAPNNRAKMIRGLIEAGGILCTSDVVKLLRCSPPTARNEMEALSVLGFVDKTGDGKDEPGHPETRITLTSRFAWFQSDECKSLMGMIPDTQGGNPFFNIHPGPGIKKENPPCVTVNDANKQAEPVIDEFGVARL